MSDDSAKRFEQQARGKRTGLVREFIDFLRWNKKWWLLPILITFLLLGALVVLAPSGLAPFIYPLF